MGGRSNHGATLVAIAILILNASIRAGVELQGSRDATVGYDILRRAFDNLYDCDIQTILKLVLRNRRGEESLRSAEVARKRIEGRLYAYGRFTAPPWMRDTAVLIVDNPERSDDHFLFLPDEHRVRRVTSVQRTDAFLGSDLWYEDLERRYPDDYQIVSIRSATFGNEAVDVIEATPVGHSGYARVEFVVAHADNLLLKSSFFKAESKAPFKTIEVPSRAEAVKRDGHVIPTRLLVRNALRGTTTEVRFERLEINPELSNGLFSAAAIAAGRRIPGLSE